MLLRGPRRSTDDAACPGKTLKLAPRLTAGVCIVHLLRNSFPYAFRKDWSQIAKDLKPVYTAPSEAAVVDRYAEFAGKWEELGRK
jgi:putative transposase